MSNDHHEVIDYEKLVNDYNDSLNSVLRGFRPKYDFLELWVPDANPISSVKNLVESAINQGHCAVSLFFSAEVLEQINFDALCKEMKSYGPIEQESTAGGKTIHLNRIEGKIKSSEMIDPLYKENIIELYESLAHQGSILEDGDNLLIRSTTEGVSLFGAVHVASHTIHRARFSGTNRTVEAALLEGLCRIIEGLPIQEAADHGLIKLEYMLRDKSQARGVKGIANVFNYPPIFKMAQTLVRDLFATYIKKTGYKVVDNFYHPAISQKWKALPESDKSEAVTKVFEHLLKKEGGPYGKYAVTLNILGIELHRRININIQGELPAETRAALYMDFEKELRKELEPSIEVFSQNIKDHNAIRRAIS